MNRRTFLATTAGLSLSIAGCAGLGDDGDESTPESTPTSAPEPTATPEPTPTDTPTETETETETPTPEETETEEPTPDTPTDEDVARDHVESGQEKLRSGIEIFLSYGDDAEELTDVTPLAESFSRSDVVNQVRTAYDSLDNAESVEADGVAAEIEAVETEVDLMVEIAGAQNKSVEVNAIVEDILSQLSSENVSAARQREFDLEDELSFLDDYVETMDGLVAALDDTDADVEPQAEYPAKLEQTRGEADLYADLGSLFEDIRDGIDQLDSARNAMDSEDYNTAQSRASRAQDTFNDIRLDLRDLDPVSIESTIEHAENTCDSHRDTARRIEDDAAREADQQSG